MYNIIFAWGDFGNRNGHPEGTALLKKSSRVVI